MKKHRNQLIAMTLLCGSWLLAAACVPAQDEPGRSQADAGQGGRGHVGQPRAHVR